MEENKKVTIVTHNSNFHTDDIFAVATLLLILGDENTTVVRSREKEVIEKADYVVDVGDTYNPDKNRFDHHQEGRAGVRENGIPYASFGLVWKKFGPKLCGNLEVANKVDQILVQPIDAGDNGFDLVETKIPGIYPYDIGLFFNTFTPGLKEESVNIDDSFMEAVSVAKMVLHREIFKRKELVEVREIIETIYKNTEDKRLIILPKFYPVTEVLSKKPEPLFVVFPRTDGTWVLKGLKNDNNSFVYRKYLPKSWSAKRGKELEDITGVPGAIFCHNDLFIAGAKTKEGILKMAEIALNS